MLQALDNYKLSGSNYFLHASQSKMAIKPTGISAIVNST